MLMSTRYNAGRIRVKDCPFGQPDGTVNQFQLVDRHGHPVTKDVRLQSIHQTDWQGRVELVDQPRTNNCKYSSMQGPSWLFNDAGLSSANSPNPAPDGQGYMTRTTYGTETARTGQLSVMQDSFATVGTQQIIRCFVRRDTNRYCGLNGFGNGAGGVGFDLQSGTYQINDNWDDAGIVLLSNTLALIWGIVTPDFNSRVYFTFSPDISNKNKAPLGSYIDWWGAMSLAGTDDPLGAYIPVPSTSTVTVTDYTHDGQGGITTGQVPADGATLYWTGTARRA